jgi:hypothetical protein
MKLLIMQHLVTSSLLVPNIVVRLRSSRHHGMARPLVAGGEGLQICKQTANVLNNQSRTADKGCSSGFGVG